MNRLLATCYVLLVTGLFIYSYGFVDFNLTLSSHPLVMSFIEWTRSLAMFNRPASLLVYLGLISAFFLIYVLALVLAKFERFPWKLTILLALILSLSYPLLSSDVFKYLFSARMVIDYGLNPHLVAPMQVPADDLWLRFMRWIHTPSPYGYGMTALAIPYYLLGLKKFMLTFYFFKLDQAAWYLLSVYLVGKLGDKLKLSQKGVILAQLFFALNPLVLIEWLSNSHNDAPMVALLLLALYLLSLSKYLWSFIFLLLSASIKYVTVVLLPIIFIQRFVRASRGTPLLLTIYYLLFTLALAPYLYHYTSQFQPWYITWLVPLAGLTASPVIMILTAAYSLGALLRYVPFINTGLWLATPGQFALLTYTPLILVSVYLALARLRNKY